jgi:hypothetical protein
MSLTRINYSELYSLILGITHALPITITAFVDCRPRKTNNPYNCIYKLSKVNGFTGTDYEDGINRRREKEGSTADFVAKARKWGVHVTNALVKHTNKEGETNYYLSFLPIHSKAPLYFVRSGPLSTWQLVSRSTVSPWLPTVVDPAESQGLEVGRYYRDYRLDNIHAITINGKSYRVRNAMHPQWIKPTV